MLYPSTCHQDTTPGKNLAAFTGVPNRNCYCDNEPWSGRDKGGRPRNMSQYVMRRIDNNTMALKLITLGSGPCSESGNRVNWDSGPEFQLKRYIPGFTKDFTPW